jgi:hypothetical protein
MLWKGEEYVIIVCVLFCTSRAASAVGGIGTCWSPLLEQASPKLMEKLTNHASPPPLYFHMRLLKIAVSAYSH